MGSHSSHIPAVSPAPIAPPQPHQPPPHPRVEHPQLHPELRQLDAELHRLARGAGRLRLRIGQALHRLGEGIHELGFSTLGAYSLERCNRGARWAAESRTLARRLESLPRLTGALESGAIGWSMAELLARHATPQTEAALLTIASAQTVQSMRLAFAREGTPNNRADSGHRAAPHTQCDAADEDELARSLSLTLPVESAWALEATRMMVEHMDGKHTGAHFLESLLAEATIALLDLTAPTQADQADVTAKMEAEHTAWRAQLQHLQHQQARAELQARPAVTSAPNPGEAPDFDDLPTGTQSIQALDARIRHYSAELASRALFFGRIAQRFLALRGWQSLGFATEAHYARERLGMSRASLRGKVSLARRTQGLDHIIDALQQGRIGFEAAQLIARIATPSTERAWLTRTTRRTFKHLREEVQAIETATRYLGEPNTTPPTQHQLHQIEATERAILSGELLTKVINNLDSTKPTDTDPNPNAQDNSVQISVGQGAKITLRFRVPGDVLLHYRQLERLHREKFPNESFIQFLCVNFWQTWVPHLGTSDKWEQIYRRDRYRCTSPVCHQRNVTLHHVQYRSQGGTDDPENLTSPCPFCHLEGEHGGRLRILPPGNNPTWLLGRHPIIKVQNRERTLLN